MSTLVKEPKVELKLSPAELRKQVEAKIREVAQSQIIHFYEETGLALNQISIKVINDLIVPNYKGPKVISVSTAIY